MQVHDAKACQSPPRTAIEDVNIWREANTVDTYDVDIVARIGDGDELSVVREAQGVDRIAEYMEVN